jgi:hypothetical protein
MGCARTHTYLIVTQLNIDDCISQKIVKHPVTFVESVRFERSTHAQEAS